MRILQFAGVELRKIQENFGERKYKSRFNFKVFHFKTYLRC